MDDLECLLGGYKSNGAKCSVPEECQHCGFESHEADRRKQTINTLGLTQRKGKLRGVAIQR